MLNFRTLLLRYFDLRTDKVAEEETIANITADASFRGARLWVLIFAIFIASLGLNVNSTAVIIGAMLISPLMGPIIGMGLAVGIGDGETTEDGLFSIETVACLGCCSLAPVLSINGRVDGKLDRKSLTKILNEYKAKG